MTTAAAKLRLLESVNMIRVASAVLGGAEDLMASLNVGQMESGKDADGAPLYYYRSEWYADWKLSLAGYTAPQGIADFKVTGAFHDSVFARVEGTDIEFSATDTKTEDLLDKSKNMFGLTSESKDELIESYLQEAFVKGMADIQRL